MKLKFRKYCFLLVVCFLTQVFAQKPIVSPRDSVKMNFNGKIIAVNYGKPSMLGRKIFGAFVPYYKVWRTGAGAATVLTTDADLEVDGAVVPRGTYSLYTLPAEERWKLIINKQTGQWGTTYMPQLDLARIDLKVAKLKTPVEECTFKLEKNGTGSGTLKIEWENTSLSVPFHISKDSLMPSPPDSSVLVINNKRLSVNYSRPSMRGRKIMGSVVPYGVVWRTGANAATSFVTQTDIVVSGVTIPRGSYTLYTLPSSNQWKLIINKQTGQWGTVYNEKLDFARIPLKKVLLKQPVEKFTMTLERTAEKSGVMKLAWEKTQLSVNFQLK
ncbi:MAG: DUF2911 domain-containing protein [Ignavibacteriales bacterium]|nr:DUF2911 domain-containing protein [Ignavibacteriales bacterium]